MEHSEYIVLKYLISAWVITKLLELPVKAPKANRTIFQKYHYELSKLQIMAVVTGSLNCPICKKYIEFEWP